ncbi:MAG: FHA domain-containing protein, partial [Planctomycetota bacterium]|nr:FHA domain-containing protein [Planctomycetota bacterium]
MPYLVAFGALKRDVYELGEEVVVVGRERKATFSLSDFQVSRRHAEITFKEGTYHVRDLNSRNGFFHNQKHVRSGEGINLDHGDELVLGRTGIRYYRRDPGDVDNLTAPIIPDSLKNIPNTRPEEGESKGNEAGARKNSARAAKKNARNSNAEQDVVADDDDFGVETDDIANISDAAPPKKKGGGLDSEVLKYAAGATPKAPEGEESKSKRNRYTELSEDIGETKAS